jgi:hypothetical protein
MFRHLNTADRAAAVLAFAQSLVPEALAELDALVARVAAARGDRSKIHDAGRALDEIARGRLYRLRRLRSMSELLASIGISRTTAHKWRVLARELDETSVAELGVEAAYQRARPPADPVPVADRRADRVTAGLRALGFDARATAVTLGGSRRVRVDLTAGEWDRLLRAASGGRRRR